ncbi:hypothetical protein ACGFZS_46720 [Streptomyces sp. NPDC048288]|uniref:hypothetical protein n=1 Tax=Streptomyces sp. NPDC048288 TaxID=3365529 RepID=UPI00371DF72F
MADGAELVKLRLTFWHGTKKPGDIVEVRRDTLHTWRGFAVPVEDETPAEQETPSSKPDDTTPSTEASTGPAKTSRTKA